LNLLTIASKLLLLGIGYCPYCNKIFVNAKEANKHFTGTKHAAKVSHTFCISTTVSTYLPYTLHSIGIVLFYSLEGVRYVQVEIYQQLLMSEAAILAGTAQPAPSSHRSEESSISFFILSVTLTLTFI
jgi:hypothetical protein